MNATKLFALTLLTAVSGAAFAGDGVLIRTGEASGHYAVPPSTPRSTLSRESVVAEVTRARAEGTLMPAGAALWGSRAMYDKPSTFARAEVKAQVMQARLDGTLIPAGEAHASSGPRATGGTSLAQAGISR
jgi:hypothetical protein